MEFKQPLLRIGVVLLTGLTAQAATRPRVLDLKSPDGTVHIQVRAEGQLSWSATLDGQALLKPSEASLELDGGRAPGRLGTFKTSRIRSGDARLHPVVPSRRAEIQDRFNELTVDFKEGWSMVFRAYDDAVAYRFVTRYTGEVTVQSERAEFRFAANHPIWFPEETSFQSHQERLYQKLHLREIGARFCSLPALVDAGAVKVALTEADLLDYPGMNLKAGDAPHSLQGLFPAYPKALACKDDRNEKVTERESFLARTSGTRAYPWRALAIARTDGQLLSHDLVYRLASEGPKADTAWIRPGKVAWDWWNANLIHGVDFKAGVNTATYKHYVDFAARHGLEYVILDEGWYPLGDLLKVVPELDMAELRAYAKSKNVGLILWCSWKTLEQHFDAAFNQFERWGIAGIKVDFMQREDQPMVRFYERVAREALKRHLLVSFHGSYKPTGLRRTFPNVMTHEGVKGLENNKWGTDANPSNAVTFPFIRMLAGPADYTPGAMLNAQKKDFKPIFDRPMSQGTRCAQLAMYVAYESPLQMLSDTPTAYEREPECLAFLEKVPCAWDETRALPCKVGEYLSLARRRGDAWYVGALTDWSARDLTLDLGFLKEGTWVAEIFQDGVNAHQVGVDYKRVVKEVQAGESLYIHLAPGGGWAARLVRK